MKPTFAVLSAGLLLSLLFTVSPAYAASSGDEWNAIKNALSDAEKAKSESEALSLLENAKKTYSDVFKEAALEVDEESDLLIEGAFLDTEARLSEGDIEQASLNRQIVDKTIYKIAFMKMESAVESGDAEDFVYWYDVMEKKFGLSGGNYESDNLISQIGRGTATLSDAGPKITAEILDIFKLKTLEEIEEAVAALEADDVASAKKFAYEGLYYYRTFHPAVAEELGQEKADELLHEMEEAITVTTSGEPISTMLEEMEHIGTEVELIIREYEGGDTSELGLALSGIYDRLDLVNIEYADAVADGKIVNQEEYDETVVFLAKAKEIYESSKADIVALSDIDASALEANFDKISTLVVNKDDPSKVAALVEASLNHVATLQDLSGGAVETEVLQYIDEIEALLNQAKEEYRAGNTQEAFDLVTAAYLDNYEFVEGPLAEADRELMEKIEIDMREELRAIIRANAPADEVDAQIDMILADLNDARMVVPEFGAIAAMILAVAIVSIIAMSAKSRLSIRV